MRWRGAVAREGEGKLQLDRKNYLPNEQVASSDRGEGEEAMPTWEALLAISYYLNGFLEASVDRGRKEGEETGG